MLCHHTNSWYKGESSLARHAPGCLINCGHRPLCCTRSAPIARQRTARAFENKGIKECVPQKAARLGAVALTALTAGAFLALVLLPADARVITERLGQSQLQEEQSNQGSVQEWFQSRQIWQKAAEQESKQKVLSVKEQVSEVLRITNDAKQAILDGDYKQGLEDFTQITRRFPDLAITNYAKIGRALLLYQTGSKNQAILELEDLEVALRGYAEVHAALASIIYTERPTEISYAEEQFDIASEFDQRYSDIKWVEREKAWPPAMLTALDKFLNLK